MTWVSSTHEPTNHLDHAKVSMPDSSFNWGAMHEQETSLSTDCPQSRCAGAQQVLEVGHSLSCPEGHLQHQQNTPHTAHTYALTHCAHAHTWLSQAILHLIMCGNNSSPDKHSHSDTGDRVMTKERHWDAKHPLKWRVAASPYCDELLVTLKYMCHPKAFYQALPVKRCNRTGTPDLLPTDHTLLSAQ